MIHELNPRLIYASVKGFGPGPYEDCKVYENIAQCTGGAASTTGFDDGPPLVTGAQIGDFGNRHSSRRGNSCRRFFSARKAARDSVSLAPCRIPCSISAGSSCAINNDLAAGPLMEYPQYPNGVFGDAVPRAGNASGGGQPGWAVRTKGGGPNDYIYVIIQPPGWEPLMKLCGRPELITDPEWATPEKRLPKLDKCFEIIEQWTMKLDKLEVMRKLNEFDMPCGPILDMGEIAAEQALRETGTVVEVDHPKRGKFLDRRKSDQIVRFADGGETVAAIGRTHGRDLEIHCRLERCRNRRGAQRGRGLNPATLRRQN